MQKKIILNIKQRFYKQEYIISISNLRIVSMIPGDREVAGCFIFSSIFGDII